MMNSTGRRRNQASGSERLPLLTSSQSDHSILFYLLRRGLQQAPWTRAEPSACIGIVVADKEERNIVLPWYPPEAAKIHHGENISIAIILIADLELFKVCLIVHVPAEDDGAEAKAFGSDGEKLLLGYELATELTIDIDSSDFDLSVIFKQLG